MSAICSSCGAPVVWATTGSGKAIPLNEHQTDNGNVELSNHGGRLTAKVWGTSHTWPPDTPRYTTHFASCSHAGEHRRTPRRPRARSP